MAESKKKGFTKALPNFNNNATNQTIDSDGNLTGEAGTWAGSTQPNAPNFVIKHTSTTKGNHNDDTHPVLPLSTIVKHRFNEVGSSSSTSVFPPDPDGITWAVMGGEREPLMRRWNYPLIDQSNGLPAGNSFFYGQETTTGQNTQVPQYERVLKLSESADEEHFQHIFNWPVKHTLENRTVGAFYKETLEDTEATDTDVLLYGLKADFRGVDGAHDLNLARTDSQIGYDTVDNNGNWVFNPITLNSAGRITNAAAKNYIGDPIMYHGGTPDNCIFFNYHSTVNSWVRTGPQRLAGWGDFLNDYAVYPSKEISLTGAQTTTLDVDITVTGTYTIEVASDNNGSVSFNGTTATTAAYTNHITTVTQTTSVTSIGTKTINVSITNATTDSGGSAINPNTWLVNPAGIGFTIKDPSGNIVASSLNLVKAVGTTEVLRPGDKVVGKNFNTEAATEFTLGKVVNYTVEVALNRIAYSHSKKYVEPAWIKLNSVVDINIGDIVEGTGIQKGTKVVGIEYTTSKISLNLALNKKKVKVVRFISASCNQVHQNTLCYATITDSITLDTATGRPTTGFGKASPVSAITNDADELYTVKRDGSNLPYQIRIRAGRGIRNRSAITGVYYTDNRKDIEYTPVFYSADRKCDKTTMEDANGIYTLGTIYWSDKTKSEDKWLLTYPKTDIAYRIASIYMAFTYGLLEKSQFEEFFAEYSTHENLIQTYGVINAYSKTNLGGKRSLQAIDSNCRDEITLEYQKSYDPLKESSDIDNLLTESKKNLEDVCLDVREDPPETLEDVKAKFTEIVKNSLSQSSFLPDEYYNKLISNEDSIYNKITAASDIMATSATNKSKFSNLPPEIEGEDNSGRIFSKENFRQLPPAMTRVRYFPNDLQIGTDEDIDPVEDLDPKTTHNQPRLIIRTIPRWQWNESGVANGNLTFDSKSSKWTNQTVTTDDGEGPAASFASQNVTGAIVLEDGDQMVLNATVNRDASNYNYVTSITTSLSPNGGTSSYNSNNYDECLFRNWVAPNPKGDVDNRFFGTRSSNSPIYTNVVLPPSWRDYQYLYADKEDGSEVGNPALSAYPTTLWENNVNYQSEYRKTFHYRLQEATLNMAEMTKNYGNPYLDEPIKAKLTKDLSATATTIEVDSTDGFLSSGYLIIPKYTKKLHTQESGNLEPVFTYCGEEIIWYTGKTSTSFTGCSRGQFASESPDFGSGTFDVTIPVTELEIDVRYKIATLGNTDWELMEVEDAKVGTIFIPTKDGNGTGTVTVFGSIPDEEIPKDKLLGGVSDPPKVAIMTSYEKGFRIAQFPVFRTQE